MFNSLPEGRPYHSLCVLLSSRFLPTPTLLSYLLKPLHKTLTHSALASSHLLRLHIYGRTASSIYSTLVEWKFWEFDPKAECRKENPIQSGTVKIKEKKKPGALSESKIRRVSMATDSMSALGTYK